MMPHEINQPLGDPMPMDAIQLILKKKLEGFLIFCAVVIAGIGMSFILPPQYKITEILRLAQIDSHLIETTQTINEFLQSDTELARLAQELHTTPGKARERFTIRDMGANPNFAVIIGRGTTPEEAIQSIQVIRDKILARQKALYEPVRKQFENEINTIENDKEKTKNDTQRLTTVVARLSNEINQYQIEIATRTNAQSEAQGRIVETYINLLADTKSRKDTTTQEIANLQQYLFNLENTKQAQILKLAYAFSPPAVEIPALTPSKGTLPPDLIKNIIYSSVLGVFLGIVWMFFRTYHIRTQHNSPPVS